MTQLPIKIIEIYDKGYNEDQDSLIYEVIYRENNKFDKVNFYLRKNNVLISPDYKKYRNILALTGLEICSNAHKSVPQYYMFMSIDKLYSFLSGEDIKNCNFFGIYTFFMNDALEGGLFMTPTECYSLVSHDPAMEVLVKFDRIDKDVKVTKTPGDYYFMEKTKVTVNQYSVPIINNTTFKANKFIIPKLGRFAKWNELESVAENGT